MLHYHKSAHNFSTNASLTCPTETVFGSVTELLTGFRLKRTDTANAVAIQHMVQEIIFLKISCKCNDILHSVISFFARHLVQRKLKRHCACCAIYITQRHIVTCKTSSSISLYHRILTITNYAFQIKSSTCLKKESSYGSSEDFESMNVKVKIEILF